MLYRRELIAGGLATLGASVLTARPLVAAESIGSSKTLADDIAILREALTLLHPGLYRYLSPRQAEVGMAMLERTYINAPDQAARYLALSRFLATIRCGHSYANFYNQKKAVRADLFDRKTRLPFSFRWIDSAMIITSDHGSGAGLIPGTEVRSINGMRSADMLARLMPYVRADGNNDAKRLALLSVTGRDEFETFDVFQGLVFGQPRGDVHRLQLRAPEGKIRSVEVPAISLAERQKFRKSVLTRGDQPLWQWEMRADGTAILTMNDWGTYDTKWDWKGWLADRLNALNGARALIVDIRANEGGEDCGNEIIARFAKSDVLLGEQRRLIRYRTTPKTLDPYLDTWDNSFRRLGVDAKPYDSRFLQLAGGDADNVIAARGPRIDLPMAILIGPQNSSATFQFAARCKRAGIATLIGQPTGGNQRGINGGRFFFVRLPASGLEFDLPLIADFPASAAPDAGLSPDITIAQTAQDIAAYRDVVMESAIKRLAKA